MSNSMKIGDTAATLESTLTWPGQDLSTVEGVTAVFWHKETKETWTAAATVTAATANVITVEVVPDASHLATPGTVYLEWTTTWPGGYVKTFPTASCLMFTVIPNLNYLAQ